MNTFHATAQNDNPAWFLGKNLHGKPILNESGQLLSQLVGRVEVWWGTNRLMGSFGPGQPDNRLVIDGFFALGTLHLPFPYESDLATITVRAWDVSVGATYSDAVVAGHGFGTADCEVRVVHGLPPPHGLDESFPGLQLRFALPHVALVRTAHSATILVQGQADLPHVVESAPSPTGPWSMVAAFVGAGRDVDLPFSVALESRSLFYRASVR